MTFTFSVSAFAGKNGLYFLEGNNAGQRVENAGPLSYTAACHKGNPWAVRRRLIKMVADDIERDENRVWYDKESTDLHYSFVDSKCVGDSLDATYDSCRVELVFEECE